MKRIKAWMYRRHITYNEWKVSNAWLHLQAGMFQHNMIIDNLVKREGTWTLKPDALLFTTQVVFNLPSQSICSCSFFKCWLMRQRALKDKHFIFFWIDWFRSRTFIALFTQTVRSYTVFVKSISQCKVLELGHFVKQKGSRLVLRITYNVNVRVTYHIN